jgi:hypothetical protein
MEAAHIIPFSLNKFNDNVISSPEIVRSMIISPTVTSHGTLSRLHIQKAAAFTWEMLRAWTLLDFKTLIGSNINSSSNVIYMTGSDHSSFGRFMFYLDKEVVSHLRGDLLGVPVYLRADTF